MKLSTNNCNYLKQYFKTTLNIIPDLQHTDFMLWVGADRTREDVDGISDNQHDTRLCTEGLLLRGGSSGGGYRGKLSSISLWKLQSKKCIYIYGLNLII